MSSYSSNEDEPLRKERFQAKQAIRGEVWRGARKSIMP